MKNFGFYLILLFLISCGYSPIYENKQTPNFKINSITISGDKKIARSIANGIEKFKKSKSNNAYDLDLVITKRNNIITKDKKGNASSYNLIIQIDINLEDNKKTKTIKRKFIKNTTYNSMDNKFELNQYKIDLEKNITSQILQDIIVFFGNIENDF
tara:strand:- start:153 stop:620 length:468 start_codon:yes stop_codon:yes gene_type:complete